MKLSIVDVVPVRQGQDSQQAMTVTTETARWADAAGFTRYWLAEHHNTAAVAATNPPVLAAILAGATSQIRVGAGGVMLPNHSPLVVAEQFALLEAAYPGRIDLGLGRASGSDPVVSALLHRSGNTSDVNEFPQYVDEIRGLLRPEGIGVNVGQGRKYDLLATPEAASVPPIWLLGSSDYSARLAAEQGLPFVFAHHFGMSSPAPALAYYRENFVPSAELAEPKTFITVAAVAADTAEEAEARALPQLVGTTQRRMGKPQGKSLSVEAAQAVQLDEGERGIIAGLKSNWIIGDGDTVAEGLRELAARYDVDELMISPWVSENAATPGDESPARLHSLKLIADRLL